MKTLTLLTLTSLLSPAFSNPEWATNPPTLDVLHPIYISSVFFPPEMRFAMYAPPKDPELLHSLDSLSWCRDAVDVTSNLSSGSRTPYFTFKGIDGLKIHDFFTDQAYITRHGTRFANCFVGPQSGELGFCEGRKDEGEKFLGVAARVWSCYVIPRPDRNKDVVAPKEGIVDGVTGSAPVGESKETGKAAGAIKTPLGPQQ